MNIEKFLTFVFVVSASYGMQHPIGMGRGFHGYGAMGHGAAGAPAPGYAAAPGAAPGYGYGMYTFFSAAPQAGQHLVSRKVFHFTVYL